MASRSPTPSFRKPFSYPPLTFDGNACVEPNKATLEEAQTKSKKKKKVSGKTYATIDQASQAQKFTIQAATVWTDYIFCQSYFSFKTLRHQLQNYNGLDSGDPHHSTYLFCTTHAQKQSQDAEERMAQHDSYSASNLHA